jgi:hypothetical protein
MPLCLAQNPCFFARHRAVFPHFGGPMTPQCACPRIACVKTLGTVGEAYLNERPMLSLPTLLSGRRDNWAQAQARIVKCDYDFLSDLNELAHGKQMSAQGDMSWLGSQNGSPGSVYLMVPINLLGFVFGRLKPTVPSRSKCRRPLQKSTSGFDSGYATSQTRTE